MCAAKLIQPDWPAPDNIIAGTSTRAGGVSTAPYDSFNLGLHTGDQPEHVLANRQLLNKLCRASNRKKSHSTLRWHWLEQIHSNHVLDLDIQTIKNSENNTLFESQLTADASITRRSFTVCTVLTADCLPILLCDKQGRRVAAIHAGWRGLAAGIVDNTLGLFCEGKPADKPLAVRDILAWLGPAIGPTRFEVGAEVKAQFVDYFSTPPTANNSQADCRAAFSPLSLQPQTNPHELKFLADLYQLARLALQRNGVTRIYGGEYCTHSEDEHFFSYRRDGATGRMASFIYRV